jgi:predicted TIM-barrel fold metal-dependent hydrolase
VSGAVSSAVGETHSGALSGAFIVDAHLHTGEHGPFFAPESGGSRLRALMDRLGIERAVLAGSWAALTRGGEAAHEAMRREHEESGGRIRYLGVFDAREPADSLRLLEKVKAWPGFQGIKIHPSFHKVPAEDPSYERVWSFADDNDLTILAHTWSPSDYNPVQALSLPSRYERHVRAHPEVRFVMAHCGGRSSGRAEALRMANAYPRVFLDLAGDIFCLRLLETLCAAVPEDRIIFGSDYPWLDPRANLSRVLLADVPDSWKKMVLRDNAIRAYGLSKEYS